MRKAMIGGRRFTFWRTTAAVCLAINFVAAVARADDEKVPPLPADVSAATTADGRGAGSGDLGKYADTLASPVGPVFRLHMDSAVKVGEGKRNLRKAMAEKFGPDRGPTPSRTPSTTSS